MLENETAVAVLGQGLVSKMQPPVFDLAGHASVVRRSSARPLHTLVSSFWRNGSGARQTSPVPDLQSKKPPGVCPPDGKLQVITRGTGASRAEPSR